MLNLDQAVEFVRPYGNEVEQARLEYILANERPSQEVIARLFAGQREDGGWAPFWASDYSSLDATCFRLAQAEGLGLAGTESAIVRAVRFLAQRQSPDGSWEEDQAVTGFAPPWAAPGDLSARLYLTANCGLWLALLGDTGGGASKAAGYLQDYLGQDGHLPGFLHTHWLAGGLWRKLNWEEPSERVFDYLARRINDLAASNLSWLITTVCVAPGAAGGAQGAARVTPGHDLVGEAASLLERSQGADGRWASEDGPGQDVHATLEAIRALQLCGRVVR